MKNSTIKAIYTLLLVLLAGTAYGQSVLPKCPSQCEIKGKLYNCPYQRKLCYGPVIDEQQEVFYEGEWLDGGFTGQGVKVLKNGDIQIRVGRFDSGSRLHHSLQTFLPSL